MLSALATAVVTFFAIVPSIKSGDAVGWVGYVGIVFLSVLLGTVFSIGSFLSIRELLRRNHSIEAVESNLQRRLDDFIVPNMRKLLIRESEKLTEITIQEYKRGGMRIDLHVFARAGELWKIIASSADPSETNIYQIGLKPNEGVVGLTSNLTVPTILEVESNQVFNQFNELIDEQEPLRLQNRGRLGGSICWIYAAPIWERSFLKESNYSQKAVGILAFDAVDPHADVFFFNRNFQNTLNASAYEIAPYVTVFTTLRRDGSTDNQWGN